MTTSIEYQAFFQKVKWMGWMLDGDTNGKPDSNRLLQALEVRLLNPPPGMQIVYDVRFPGSGWEGSVSNGTVIGKTDDPDKYIDAICLDLVNRPPDNKDLTVVYKAYSRNKQAWTGDARNGQALIVSGGITAIQVRLV